MEIKTALQSIVLELKRHGYSTHLGQPRRGIDDFVAVKLAEGQFTTTSILLQQPPMMVDIVRVVKLTGQKNDTKFAEIADFVDSTNDKSIQAIFTDPSNPPKLPNGLGVQPVSFAPFDDDRNVGMAVRCRLVISK